MIFDFFVEKDFPLRSSDRNRKCGRCSVVSSLVEDLKEVKGFPLAHLEAGSVELRKFVFFAFVKFDSSQSRIFCYT